MSVFHSEGFYHWFDSSFWSPALGTCNLRHVSIPWGGPDRSLSSAGERIQDGETPRDATWDPHTHAQMWVAYCHHHSVFMLHIIIILQCLCCISLMFMLHIIIILHCLCCISSSSVTVYVAYHYHPSVFMLQIIIILQCCRAPLAS